MLAGKKILIGITGSIAAYKAILLVRLFTKAGAEVRIVMTPAAKDFVSVITLSTLCGQKVAIDLHDEQSWSNHVMLGRWADIFLIAPLSCNSLAKMAQGICDNLFLAVYLSSTCPVVVAPAMDEDMWLHKATQNNLAKITEHGCYVIPVKHGELASGLTGMGRMTEPEEIVQYITETFFSTKLKNKKILITAGPTYEAIDPVRFIGNHSSGKMGIELARACVQQGANVALVLGPVHINVNLPNTEITRVTSAGEMYMACMDIFPHCDVAIMAAAVADFTPKIVSNYKIKKSGEEIAIELQPTKDILKSIGSLKKEGQIIIGFALETDNAIENARKKLDTKNADMIVLNSLEDQQAGFAKDTNKITILQKNRPNTYFGVKTKAGVAQDIINELVNTFYA